jgi:hypothetical protein
MRRRSRDQQERVIRSLLARLAADRGDPSETELRRAARLASAEGRSPQERPSARTRPWRPLRLRWAAGGAAALLIATGLGFGVASWLTPASSARSDVEGFGFLPASGWTVIQAGLPGSAESTRMVAANVALSPADPQRGLPLPALHAWPPWAIVISATLSPRGDRARDAAFPVRALPLRLADAAPVTLPGQPTLEYVLRAAVNGYNIDASVTFASEPTTSMFEKADEQIARLVVAPAAVTIAVKPTIYGRAGPLVVSGSVTSGKKNETVTVQFKQCGLAPEQFRDDFEVKTEDGGGWSVETGVSANGVFRAVSGGETSNEVQVQKRVDVRLAPAPPGRYEVNVVEQSSFWRKRVVVQRFDKRTRKWVLAKKVRLEHSSAAPGSIYVWSVTDEFAVKVSKGTTIRAVLPLDQARPCHIGGYSNLLVTK